MRVYRFTHITRVLQNNTIYRVSREENNTRCDISEDNRFLFSFLFIFMYDSRVIKITKCYNNRYDYITFICFSVKKLKKNTNQHFLSCSIVERFYIRCPRGVHNICHFSLDYFSRNSVLVYSHLISFADGFSLSKHYV